MLRAPLRSEEEMISFGERVGAALEEGDLLLLSGALGAGKTTFAKGVLKEVAGLSPEEVQSPTYTYVHPYHGRCPVFHFDLYRLEDESLFFDLDLDAYLQAGGISLVEWPERVSSLRALGKRVIEITFSHLPGGREVELRGLAL